VRVGITPLGSAGGLSPTTGRDRLVKALNKQKKSDVEAVALDASGDQISAEARERNCEFVVVATQTDLHSSSEVNFGRTSSSNVTKYHVEVEYKLYRAVDASVVASGSAKAEDMASPADVEGQALDNVAKKVTADIKKAATAPASK